MIASALCIVVGTALVSIPAQRFTLRWQHTVEKIVWEEDYVVAGDWLYLSGARVQGSGAGMEPPPDADQGRRVRGTTARRIDGTAP